jgi:hypothetical protein
MTLLLESARIGVFAKKHHYFKTNGPILIK